MTPPHQSVRQLETERSNRSGSAAVPRMRLQFRLEYHALRSIDRFARALPLEVAVRLSGAVWRGIGPHLGRHRRAERHLAAMMPELSAAERQRILRSMWRHLGETFVEALQLDRIAAEPDRIALDSMHRTVVRRAMEEGGIVVTPHLGNWEAAVLPLAAQQGATHVGVYRPAKNPLVDAYVLRARGPYYRGGLFAKGQAAARGLLRQARKGGSLGIMADLRDSGGVHVPLFGHPAPSTPLPAMLARQFGRPLFAVCLVRVGTSRFCLKASEIEVPQTDDRAADILVATARIQQVFEGWIRQWPEQWTWAHRRYDY
jgi:KDO2-lipid IV(A) lauroyltransferase